MNICAKKSVMTAEEYALLRDLVERKIGIVMKHDRRLTLHAKVSHRLMILGLTNYRAYYDFIASDPTGEELFTLASHVTNNETFFFREKPQLDLFSALLPEIKREKQKKGHNTLRILSLASSSGEETYSLNILVQESGLFVRDWDIQITGMDIDRTAIEKAGKACYAANSFRMLDGNDEFTVEYFTIDEGLYVLKRAYTKNTQFRHGNVLESSSFCGLDTMDIIFCRNMLIYMSDESVGKVARNCYNSLSDTGYLFVGSSESLIQRTDLFVPEYKNGIVVYRKRGDIKDASK